MYAREQIQILCHLIYGFKDFFYLLLRKIQAENALGSNGVITLKTKEKTLLNFLKKCLLVIYKNITMQKKQHYKIYREHKLFKMLS